MCKLGEQIKFYRSKNQLTLKDVSDKTGLSLSFVSEIERGKRNPSLDNLQKIAEALGVSIINLIGSIEYIEETTKQNFKHPRLIKAIARAEDLPDEDINDVADTLDFLIQQKKDKHKKEK